jgi:hypothetical protein
VLRAQQEIARLSAKLWLREIAGIFRSSERRVIFLGFCALFIACAFGALLAIVSSGQVNFDLPPELQETILRTSLGGAILSTGVIATILCVTSPPRTALQTLLDMLPVSRRTAQLGQLLPIILIGTVFSLVLSSTSIAILLKLLSGGLQIFSALLLLVMLIVITECIVIGIFQILMSALRRFLRLPTQYSASLAAVVTMSISIGSVVGDIFALRPDTYDGFELTDLMLNRVMASVLLRPGDIGQWALLASWCSVAALLLISSGSVYRQQLEPAAIALFSKTKPRNGSFYAAVWLNFLIGVRNPQTIVTAIALIPFIAVVAWLKTIPFLTDIAVSLANGIPVVPCLLAMYAVGRTIHIRWLGAHLLAKETWWIFPKICAYALIIMAISVPTMAIELGVGLVGLNDIGAIAARACVAFTAALVGGALIPYSEEQPISVTASGFATAVLYLGVSLGLTVLSSYVAQSVLTLITLGCACILLLTFVRIAQNQSKLYVARSAQ